MHDIKPLLVFAAVLEQGSMNAAAAALGMTPSAVSQHITRLESLHGVKLLRRSTRRLAPTDAGRALLAHCHRLRHTLADMKTALNNLKTEAAGEVHLAATSGMVGTPMFQTALKRLQREYPDIRPVLHIGDRLIDMQQGGIDIAIRGGEHALDDADLIARHLVSWRWQIFAAPDYLARHPPIERPEQLHRHSWLHFVPVRATLRCAAESYLLDIADSMPCSQLSAVCALTVGGIGLSMQLGGEVRQYVQQGSLEVVLPQWLAPVVNIYAVTSYRVQSAKTEAVLKILQQVSAADDRSVAESGKTTDQAV
ncbi:LysR family transcriptional regulator [Neisseria musculi]|uniref:LysR substrate binding domain protein n=1 Tax=Neisseria musculi TaxID=1815583 RepID=A0A7H1MAS3_9NEIS|nr:LysR family transcriptional regulator [Neisseria musculi]QNT58738.1 lysR substrate binding domain protein [Neisseria musculi]